jgi:glycosyltransferase involved in cell wall biosynthesis
VRTPSLTIFVPAHNEAKNVAGAVQDVVEAASDTCPDYEVLVVDDGSTDGTGEVADRLARANPRIRIIHNRPKQGLAGGYRTALNAATKDYFAFIPGDREIRADSIRAIFGAIGSADLVVPYHANQEARAWHRRVLTIVSTGLINLLFRRGLRYYQGPTVYPTALARALPTRTRGFFFLAEMLLHALDRGCTYVEVGLVHQERAFGKSKAVTLSNIVMALRAILGTWWVLHVHRAGPSAVREPSELTPDRHMGGRVKS